MFRCFRSCNGVAEMRIAQVSPLVESVPPKLYGGTERIVSYLTEELVRQGHEVALFASGDSETTAELIPCAPQALRLAHVDDTLPYSVLQLEKIRQRARNFDVLHFHWDYFHLPLVRCLASPAVTTMHGRMDLPNYQPLFAEFADMALVSVSDHQRKPLSARWIATVPHGLPADLYSFSPEGADGYLAFLGRICPEKRPDRAIEIATRAGVELKIAAKVDKVDMAYFEDVIRPLLRDPRVEFVGEVSDCEKQAFHIAADGGKSSALSGNRPVTLEPKLPHTKSHRDRATSLFPSMSCLRQGANESRCMIDDMTARSYTEHTQKDYLPASRALRVFCRPLVGHRLERACSPISIADGEGSDRCAALRFFFKVTLERPDLVRHLTCAVAIWE